VRSALLCILVGVSIGCQTHRDASNDDHVRNLGLVGRQFSLKRDVRLLEVPDDRYEKEDEDFTDTTDVFYVRAHRPERRVHPADGTALASEPRPTPTAPRGTRLRITRATYHQWPFAYACYFLYGQFLDGPHAGLETKFERVYPADDPEPTIRPTLLTPIKSP
jgi:hypothetical protein